METTFDEIDVTNISDGIYIGKYDVNFIYAKVEVTVENREIVSINILEHKHERGKAAETVVEKRERGLLLQSWFSNNVGK